MIHGMSRLPTVAKPPMPHRTIRVSNEDWHAAQAKADERDENLSEEIRKFIQDYAKLPAKKT